jgi:hypothetical protein
MIFGPDKCETDTNKVHFIFRPANPMNGPIEEKRLSRAPAGETDTISDLCPPIVRPDT